MDGRKEERNYKGYVEITNDLLKALTVFYQMYINFPKCM